MSEKVWAVVPAAGIGERFGAGKPKQYVVLRGKPMLCWTLDAFLDCDLIDGVVVALSGEDEYFHKLELSSHEKLSLSPGGVTRASSVLAALQSMEDKADRLDWVMVHDAARPLLRTQDIIKLHAAVKPPFSGAILARPVAETVKRADLQEGPDRVVLETVDRTSLWLAQTPQMFRYGQLREALELLASGERFDSITDEASAMEAMGHDVLLVEGDRSNIKLTHPDDLAFAEALFAALSRD